MKDHSAQGHEYKTVKSGIVTVSNNFQLHFQAVENAKVKAGWKERDIKKRLGSFKEYHMTLGKTGKKSNSNKADKCKIC